MLIRNSKKILKERTNKINLLNTCVKENDFKIGIKKNNKNKPKIIIEPVKPNCSEKIAKTKSVSFSGKKSKLLCDPPKKPFPRIPPDPIAILDWIIWYPFPNGSRSGLRKIITLFC